MFEKKIAKLLSEHLGDFVEGVTKEDLNISIFGGGKLDLRNLRIKETGLDLLGLPLTVLHGHVGRLRASIPITSLKSKPVVVDVDQVFLVVRPRRTHEWDEEREHALQQRIKEGKLEKWEVTIEAAAEAAEKEEKKKGWVARLVETIVKNLKFNVSNVHIRYEDDTSDTKNAFALGVTIGETGIFSADADWREAFVKKSDGFVRKLARLRDLSVYVDRLRPEEILRRQNRSFNDWVHMLRDLMPSGNKSISHQYILHPVSASLQLTMQDAPKPDNAFPRVNMEASFPNFKFDIFAWQYQSTLRALDYFNNFDKLMKWRKNRPSVSPLANPSAWWKYVLGVVRGFVRAKKFDPLAISRFLKDRKDYVVIYKKKQGCPWLDRPSLAEEEYFREIEGRLDYDAIVLNRTIARKELEIELRQHRVWEDERKRRKKEKNPGFFRRLFGAKKKEEIEEEPEWDFQVTAEQRQAITDLVASAKEEASQVFDPNLIDMQVSITIEDFCFSLSGSSNSEIAAIRGSGQTFFMQKFADRVNISTSLDSFELEDCMDHDSCFRKILRRKHAAGSSSMDPLLRISFNQKPHKDIDASLSVKLEPMEVVFNAEFVQSILGFFSIPPGINISSLSAAGVRFFKRVQSAAAGQLEELLKSEKPAFELDISLSAPKILVPCDCFSVTSRIFMLDLGDLTIVSDLSHRATGGAVSGAASSSSKGTTEASRHALALRDDFVHQLEQHSLSPDTFVFGGRSGEQDLLYDKYMLRLKNVAAMFVVATDSSATRFSVDGGYLMEPFNLFLRFEKCLAAVNEDMAEMRMAGFIPSVSLNLSTGDLPSALLIASNVMRMVDNPIGDLSSDPVTREGILEIFQSSRVMWTDRFCILRRNMLYIYSKRSDKKYQEALELTEHTRVEEEKMDGSPNSEGNHFCLKFPVTSLSSGDGHSAGERTHSLRVIRMCAPSPAEKEAWMADLRDARPSSMVISGEDGAEVDVHALGEVPLDESDLSSEEEEGTPSSSLSSTPTSRTKPTTNQLTLVALFVLRELSVTIIKCLPISPDSGRAMTSPEGEPANGLSGSSSSNSAERLLCLTLNTLSLSTSLRTLDKEVEATMRHFTIEDCARALSHPSLAEGNPYLLSSLPSSEGEPVLTVALNMFDSASPRFQGTHMDVDASLSGLTLSYFGESLAYIISALLLSLRQSTRQHRKLIAHHLQHQRMLAAAESEVEKRRRKTLSRLAKERLQQQQLNEDVESQTMHVKVQLQSFQVELLDEEDMFSQLKISSMAADVHLEGDSVDAKGQLGDICFLEFAEEMSLYGELVGVLNSTSGNLIDFGFKKRALTEEELARGNPVYTTIVKARISAIKAVYIQSVYMRVVDAIVSGVSPIQDALKKTAQDVAKKTSEMAAQAVRESAEKVDMANMVSLDIEMLSPLVIIPRNPRSAEHLEASLGKLVISNELLPAIQGRLSSNPRLSSRAIAASSSRDARLVDTFHLELSEVHLSSHGSSEDPGKRMVHDLSLQTSVGRYLPLPCDSMDDKVPVGSIEAANAKLLVNARLGAVNITVSDAQYLLLMSCLDENFLSTVEAHQDIKQLEVLGGDMDLSWLDNGLTSSMSSASLSSTASFFFSLDDDLGSEFSDLDEAVHELQMVEGEGSEQHAQRIEAFFSDPANLQKIDMKFQEADTDGSGQLEPAECLPLMSYFCKKIGVHEISLQQFREFFERYDTDGSGALSCEEFRNFVKQFFTGGQVALFSSDRRPSADEASLSSGCDLDVEDDFNFQGFEAEKALVDEAANPKLEARRNVEVHFELPSVNLALDREEEGLLAKFQVGRVAGSFFAWADGMSEVQTSVDFLNLSDLRPSGLNLFKEIICYKRPNDPAAEDSPQLEICIRMEKGEGTFIRGVFRDMTVYVVPDFVADVMRFVLEGLSPDGVAATERNVQSALGEGPPLESLQQLYLDQGQVLPPIDAEGLQPLVEGERADSEGVLDVRCATARIVLQRDLVLSERRRLFVDSDSPDRIVIDGQGQYRVVFSTLEGDVPVIFLSKGKELLFRNVALHVADCCRLDNLVECDEGAKIRAMRSQKAQVHSVVVEGTTLMGKLRLRVRLEKQQEELERRIQARRQERENQRRQEREEQGAALRAARAVVSHRGVQGSAGLSSSQDVDEDSSSVVSTPEQGKQILKFVFRIQKPTIVLPLNCSEEFTPMLVASLDADANLYYCKEPEMRLDASMKMLDLVAYVVQNGSTVEFSEIPKIVGPFTMGLDLLLAETERSVLNEERQLDGLCPIEKDRTLRHKQFLDVSVCLLLDPLDLRVAYHDVETVISILHHAQRDLEEVMKRATGTVETRKPTFEEKVAKLEPKVTYQGAVLAAGQSGGSASASAGTLKAISSPRVVPAGTTPKRFPESSTGERAADKMSQQEGAPLSPGSHGGSIVHALTGSVKCDFIRLEMVDDCRNADVPLLDFQINSISATFMGAGDFINGTAALRIEGYYFNVKVATWEPFLEPWEVQVNLRRGLTGRVKTILAAVEEPKSGAASNGGEGSSNAMPSAVNNAVSAGNEGMRTTLEVVSPFSLDINVTHAMIDTIVSTAKLWSQGLQNVRSKQEVQQASRFYPLTVRNLTGVDMRLTRALESGTEHTSLQNGASRGYSLSFKKDSQEYVSQYQFSVELPGLERGVRIPNVCVAFQGVQTVLVPNGILVIQTEVEKGAKLVTFRSPFALENNTNHRLSLRLTSPRFGASRTMFPKELEPGEIFSLPLAASDCLFAICTAGADSYSSDINPLQVIDRGTDARVALSYLSEGGPCHLVGTLESKSHRIDNLDGNLKQDSVIIYNLHIATPLTICNALPEVLTLAVTQGEGRSARKVYDGLLESGASMDLWNDSEQDLFLMAVPVIGGWEPLEPVCMSSGSRSRVKDKLVVTDRFNNALDLWLDHDIDHRTGSRITTIYVTHWIIRKCQLPVVIRHDSSGRKAIAAGQDEEYLVHLPVVDQPSSNSWEAEDAAMEDRASSMESKQSLPSSLECARSLMLFSQRSTGDKYKIHLRTLDTEEFSEGVPVNTDNASCNFSTQRPASNSQAPMCYAFSCHVKKAVGKFARSRVMTLRSMYVLVNELEVPVEIREPCFGVSMMVPAGQQVDWHWPTAQANDHMLQVRVGGMETPFSMPFLVQDQDEFDVKFRLDAALDSNRFGFIRVLTRDEYSSTFIVLRSSSKNPQFVLENRTWTHTTVRQQSQEHEWQLRGHSSLAYCWDDPRDTSPTLLVSMRGAEKAFNLDASKLNRPQYVTSVTGLETVEIYGTIVPRGSTLALVLTEGTDEISFLDNEETIEADPHEVLDDVTLSPLELRVELPNIGFSIVDKSPSEIMYASITLPLMRFKQNEREQSIEFELAGIQIDNQLYRNSHPVLLEPSGLIDTNRPFLQLSIVKSMDDPSITHYKYIGMVIQELEIIVDEALLLSILDFVSDFEPTNEELSLPEMVSKSCKTMDLPELPSVAASRLYIREMVLRSVKMYLSVMAASGGKKKKGLWNNPLSNFLGSMFKNIDRAHITFNTIEMDHICETSNSLTQRIQKLYLRELIKQIYKIVLSVDILGNPMGLVSNIGTGVKAFFEDPARGFIKSPLHVGAGLATGTFSLVKNSLHGAFNAASKVTGSIGKGLAALSMDDEYIARRAAFHQKKPRHLAEGLWQGGKSLFGGIAGGIAGIFMDPVKEARKSGFGGFFKGIGKGLLGVVVKPVTGAVGMVTKTGEGLKNTTTLLDKKASGARMRPPRAFGRNGVLLVYDEEAAEGKLILHRVEDGSFFPDLHVFHAEFGNRVFVLTDVRIICLSTGLRFKWAEPLTNIRDIQTQGQKVNFILKTPYKSGLFNRKKDVRTIKLDLSKQVEEDGFFLFMESLQKMQSQLKAVQGRGQGSAASSSTSRP